VTLLYDKAVHPSILVYHVVTLIALLSRLFSNDSCVTTRCQTRILFWQIIDYPLLQQVIADSMSYDRSFL